MRPEPWPAWRGSPVGGRSKTDSSAPVMSPREFFLHLDWGGASDAAFLGMEGNRLVATGDGGGREQQQRRSFYSVFMSYLLWHQPDLSETEQTSIVLLPSFQGQKPQFTSCLMAPSAGRKVYFSYYRLLQFVICLTVTSGDEKVYCSNCSSQMVWWRPLVVKKYIAVTAVYYSSPFILWRSLMVEK